MEADRTTSPQEDDMTQETRKTPADMVSVFGDEITPTGARCSDRRPIFRGTNGHEQCACEDHS